MNEDEPMRQKRQFWSGVKYKIIYWFEKIVSPIANSLYDWASCRMMSWYKVGDTLCRKVPIGDEMDKIVVSEIHSTPYYQICYLDLAGQLHREDVGQVFDTYKESK